MIRSVASTAFKIMHHTYSSKVLTEVNVSVPSLLRVALRNFPQLLLSLGSLLEL